MKKIILFIMLFFGFRAISVEETGSMLNLISIMQAQSEADLDEASRLTYIRKLREQECEVQLKKPQVPFSCFEFLQLRPDLSPQERQERLSALQSRCEELRLRYPLPEIEVLMRKDLNLPDGSCGALSREVLSRKLYKKGALFWPDN